MEHNLVDVVEYKERTTHYEEGLPVREPINPPYWRWYCSCGVVGGKRISRNSAVRDHKRHVSEG